MALILILALLVFPAVVPAQSLSAVSGDGQVVIQNHLTTYPLVVVARDASGKAMPGVAVNWSLSGTGTLVPGGQVITDVNGQASTSFVGATIYGDAAFTQNVVTASTSNSSVSMRVTTSGNDLVSGSVFVSAEVLSPVLGEVLSDGGTVKVHVFSVGNSGAQQVPYVSVRLIPQSTTGPTLACAAGTGITDATGIANCSVVFAGGPGSGTYSIEVGGFRTFSPFSFTATRSQSQPAAILISGGNNQSGTPGSKLPAPLTAKVVDAAGNPLPNVSVVWQPPQSISLSGVVSTSDANGMVSAIATLGSVVGPAQVTVHTANGAIQAIFSVTVTQPGQPTPGSGPPAAILITGGNNQSGPAGARLLAPLTAKVVDAAGNPLPNVPVTWQPTQSVSLSSVVSSSDANGMVSAVATTGSTLGPAQVQVRTVSTGATPFASSNNVVQTTFNLTVTQAQTGPPPSQGVPAAIRITGGNNQSGLPGARLPAALTARVEDGNGNALPNVTVTWQPPQSVTLSNVVSVSDASGIVSAIATLGSSVGPLQIQLQTQGGIPTPFGPAGGTVVQTVFALTVTQGQPAPSLGPPAAIRITGGANQSGLPGARLPGLLIARVEDAAGNPLPGVPVIWQPVVPQSATLSGAVTASDANGVVSAIATLGSSIGPVQIQLRTAGTSSILTVFNLTVTPGQPAAIRILSGDNQSGPPGARLAALLIARVEDAAGNPLPNVAVVWQPAGQSVSLTGVGSLSDANGVVSATAVLGSTAGPAQVQLRTSNGAIQTAFSVTVTPSQPAALRILGGNNQSGPPGRQLPAPLMARVEDAAGNPVPNVPVIWQPASSQSLSLSAVVFISDANGIVSANAILGSTVGPARVELRIANLPVQTVFSLQGAWTLTGIGIASGSNQEAAVGGGFAQPIVVQLYAAEGPPAGLPVQLFSSGAPVVFSNGGQALTDAAGRATVSLQAGSAPGTAIVTATAGGFSSSLILTIRAALAELSFFNAASLEPGGISPAEVVAIYGTGLAPGVQGCVTANQVLGPLPWLLSGVQVHFTSGSYSAVAPLYSVCNLGTGQEYAVVQAPADLPLMDTTVTVQVGDTTVGQSRAPAAPASPGIFETIMSDGQKRAVLQHLDGSYVSLESPAQAGERLRAFVTGLGSPVTASGVHLNTNQAGIAGDDAAPPNAVLIRLANRDVQPVSSIYSADTIGVYVVTFDVPSDVQSGSDIDFMVGTLVGDQSVFGKSSKLPIQ